MRLFIAYAQNDLGQVKQLSDVLVDLGHDTSMGYRLMPGADWKAELEKTIGEYDGVVFAVSPAASASEWCRWQLAQGVKQEKPVFPVILQETSSVPAVLGPYTVPDFSRGSNDTFLADLKNVLQHAADFKLPAQQIPAPDDPQGIPPQAHGAHTPPHMREERTED